jgi:uroporphyrinogen III methyltransferase / synthase
LEELPAVVAREKLSPPSLVIVGEVVRVRGQAKWFEDRPLFGKVIGITRPEDQADTAIDQAVALGALPVVIPTIEIGPAPNIAAVDAALDRLDQFDWLVFTSVNGVRGLLSRLWERGGDIRKLGRCKLAAIGPSTANALAEYSLRCDVVPNEYRAEALAEALSPLVNNQRVLWARADRGREVLSERLTAAGATLEQVVVYTNRDVDALPAHELGMLERGDLDWIGLSSPSIARNLAKLLTPAARQHLNTRTKLCAISPVTAAAAQEAGLPIATTATEYTWDGMFRAMAKG